MNAALRSRLAADSATAEFRRLLHIAPTRVPTWISRNLTTHPCQSMSGASATAIAPSTAPLASRSSSVGAASFPPETAPGAEASSTEGGVADAALRRAQPVHP